MSYSKIITKAEHDFDASNAVKYKAKELRKNMTTQEKILWSFIRKRQLYGMHFRRQHPYGIYILDFYCFKANLVIEVDGMIHLKQHGYDMERTKYLIASGLTVMRFKNTDIENRIEWVINKIRYHLFDLPLSRPSPKGEGAQLPFLG